MEELDKGRYSALPSNSQLAVEILNASFAWDSPNSNKISHINGLREAAFRRESTVGNRSKVKRARGRHDNDDDVADDDGDDNDVRPDPVTLLYDAAFARDDDPDVLFDINFTVAKVRVAVTR